MNENMSGMSAVELLSFMTIEALVTTRKNLTSKLKFYAEGGYEESYKAAREVVSAITEEIVSRGQNAINMSNLFELNYSNPNGMLL